MRAADRWNRSSQWRIKGSRFTRRLRLFRVLAARRGRGPCHVIPVPSRDVIPCPHPALKRGQERVKTHQLFLRTFPTRSSPAHPHASPRWLSVSTESNERFHTCNFNSGSTGSIFLRVCVSMFRNGATARSCRCRAPVPALCILGLIRGQTYCLLSRMSANVFFLFFVF